MIAGMRISHECGIFSCLCHIEARKNQILDAASLVFAEKGFHSTTIREIAKQAGVADGTIYNYFDNKPALLLGIFERMKATVLQDLPSNPKELDFHSFIRTIIRHPLTSLKHDNFALFRIIISEMMVNDELRALYYHQILEPTLAMAEVDFTEQAAQRGVSAEDAHLILRAISGMVLGLMLEHVMGDPLLAEHWDKLPDVLTDLLLNGLEHPPSI
jgi:AcrR family transcriptional regulator